MTHRFLFGALALTSLVVASCGSSGSGVSAAGGEQTIRLEMKDNRFSQDLIPVKAGYTVTFKFRNTGKVVHEAVIGDAQAQAHHEKEMVAADPGDGMGDMDMGGDAISVAPTKFGQFKYTFKAADDRLIIGCHEPNHYEQGMRITIRVTP